MAGFKVASKIKELRFLMCQTSKTSEGARNFINDHYISLKKANPKLPILVRECSNIDPKLYVRALYGKESCIPLANMNVNDIIENLRKAAT
ncbi:NADH dehydrogenase [ubiquinone] 1 alpha subcomplex subunit 2 [Phymastichus coffea]|uniref:NADH dehydrogenase [ubiquinone] 1 alpha subcomplex subunit 2 n=1 Tax=Phymastichus coffea TaxID=108790 RepID=UPI00273BE5AD|nr:NADH dehydrogenase [ubiquinone] 1 alpha subcomplex subunit 2 [Phymastichus coffea]